MRALAQQYDVTNVTANRALETLRSGGLAETRLGRGTFVRATRPVIRVGAYLTAQPGGARATWRSEGERQGFVATQDITEVATVPAPPEIAERLGLEPGSPTIVRRRILRADGIPVQLSDSYYPATLAAGTELAEPGKLRGYSFGALQRLGIELGHFRDDIELRMPTPQEATALRLGKGVPVLHLLRTTYDRQQRPVDVAHQLLAGDRYALSYEVPATPPPTERGGP